MAVNYIVNVPVTDVWDSTRETERLTQALLGDAVLGVYEKNSFVQGQVPDGYLGYLKRADLVPLSVTSNELATVIKAKAEINLEGDPSPLKKVEVFLGTRLVIKEERAGYVVVLLPDGREGQITADSLAFSTTRSEPSARAQLAGATLDYAMLLLGTPYLWGGMTCLGIDCSGLIHIVYRSAGLLLPRDADQQYDYCRLVNGPPSLGDLAFFSTEETGLASHVGLCLGPDRFVHASSRLGGVVVTSLNSPFYKERFLGWRRC
ncbi:MAG: NlpC/P60 family protein [bacterium]|jgi:cell wall-associated NlpC family hydrolase